MTASLMSGCVQGMNAFLVNVEVDLQSGLPAFNVVGLPDTSIRESKQRVRAAFKNSGLSFPMKRITVNLAPAHLKKEGSSFELAIALGLLMSELDWKNEKFRDCLFLGELSLKGKLNPIRGALPLILKAQKRGFKRAFVPKENAKEASMVKGISVYGLSDLKEMVLFFQNEISLIPSEFNFKGLRETELEDFSQVKGQPWTKKALEVAASGGHNILMMGPPGCGKSMLAKRISTILPLLSFEESLQTTQIYSVGGFLNKKDPFIFKRPFRAPHHTISYAAMVGGGKYVMPGEVSLAHHGVLFLDELAEFRKDVLEVLREPLEEKKVCIRRVYGRYDYPADFLLVAAFNPCPCGYLDHPKKSCQCSDVQIQRYKQKISGPLLDRIDIHVSVQDVSTEDTHTKAVESSSEILKRVEATRSFQKKRYENDLFSVNAQLTPTAITEYCVLEKQAESMLQKTVDLFGLSYRSYHKILKVSRTLADMEQSEKIQSLHIAQALQFRFLDR
jgi:magnesium chelatase family protein